MSDDRVRVSVTHSVVVFQHGDHLGMLRVLHLSEK